MITHLPFDIETIQNDRAPEYYRENFVAKLGNNKQRKDEPEEDWHIREAILKDAGRDKALEKAALSWWTGQVICIGYKIPGQDAKCLKGSDEKLLLMHWADLLEENNDLILIGKNSYTFDVPFLKGRYMAHNLGLPKSLRKDSRDLTDIDHLFGRGSLCSQSSKLSNYAWGLGMDGKMGDGSDVHGWYFAEGGPKWDLIEKYCAQDVEIVAEMLRRSQPYKNRNVAEHIFN